MTPRSIGVVVDPGRVLPWHRAAIELLTGEGAAVTVHPVPARPPSRTGRGLLRRVVDWEWQRSPGTPHPLDRVRLTPAPEPLERAGELDALLWLSDAEIPPALARPLPLGVWYVTQGEARRQADCPLVREVVAGTGRVETALWRFDGETHRRELVAVGTADRFSYLRALSRASAKAADLPARMVGAADTRPPAGPELLAAPGRPGPRLAAMRVVARLALRVARHRLRRRLVEERWVVAWRELPGATAGELPAGRARYSVLEAEDGHYYADPFPVEHEGAPWLLFEDFSEATGRGSIAAVEASGASGARVRPALELDSHLSYPFPFRERDELYMLPENRGSHANRVDLWRAERFPDRWTRAGTLLDGTAAGDATLLRHDGRLWLFAARAVDDGPPVDELWLFHAEDLQGPWTPHPLNPVVSDVRRARPAGPVLAAGDALLRPAQDCSRAYGWRTVLNRIDVLSPEDYRETPVAVATAAGRAALRTHTFARAGGIEAVDVLVARPRLRVPGLRARRTVELRFSPLSGAEPAPPA